jgi:hypothetical protein
MTIQSAMTFCKPSVVIFLCLTCIRASVAQEPSTLEHVRAGGSAGLRKYTSGDWALMQSEVQNTGDTPAEVLSVIYFGDDSGIQFGRKAWIPAQSRRTFWIPVRVPEGLVSAQDGPANSTLRTSSLKTLLIDQTGGRERLLRMNSEGLFDARPFSIDVAQSVTVRITDPESEDDTQAESVVATTVDVLRLMGGLNIGAPAMHDARVPVVPAALQSADHIVVTGNRLANDAPGRTAVREWVQNGGRLWLMLDTMDEDTCRQLLGDMCSIQYVDKVSLTQFRTANVRRPQDKLLEHQYETPANFVRVLVDNVDVELTINGWPSVFSKDFGRGQIVFSTIAAVTFTREKRPNENPSQFMNALRVPRQELDQIANVFFAEQTDFPFTNAEIAPLIEQKIGYEVVGKGFIVLILSAYCLALLLIGVWLSKADQIGHLLWIAPVITAVATVPLVILGSQAKQAVPSTVAVIQVIESVPGGDNLTAHGMAGVYQTEARDQPIVSKSTSVFVPDRTGVVGKAWRMVWTDLDNWQWENISLPSGLRLFPFSVTHHGSDPIRVYGTFGPDGFVGQLQPGPLTNIRDAIVASRTHVALGLTVADNGALTGPIANSLPPGQYSAENLLDDEQSSHVKVFRTILDFGINEGIDPQEDARLRTRLEKFPSKPLLLAWADPIDARFELNEDARQTGAAIVVVPIQLDRPEVGQTIRIPSVFLPYQLAQGPGNESLSVAYNNRIGIWQKRRSGSPSTIRFQLPECVLPFEATSARLRIKLNTALRDVEFQSGQVESLIDIGRENSPVGTFDFEITDPSALALDDRGGLYVRIFVGDVQIETKDADGQEILQDNDWKIDYIELQVEGQSTEVK